MRVSTLARFGLTRPILTRATLEPPLRHSALALALLLVLSFYGLTALSWSHHPGSGDFVKFHVSTRELVTGGDIYRPVSVSEAFTGAVDSREPSEKHLHPNLNPPFQTVLLAPLGYLDYPTAFLIWAFLSLLCGTVGAVLVGIRREGARDRVASGLIWAIILLAYFPSLTAIRFGQWALVPLLFLVVAWMAWRVGKAAVAGSLLGAMAAVKLFFGAFLLLFLARRSWRAAGAFAAVWALCTGAAAALTGFDSLARYGSVVGQAEWFASTWNASFLGFFSRVFGGAGNTPLVEAPYLRAGLVYGLSVLAVASLFLGPTRSTTGEDSRRQRDLAFALCIPVMLLVSPFGWIYYFTFLLIPLAVLWDVGGRMQGGRSFRLLLVAAWLLGSVPSTLISSEYVTGDFAVVFWNGGAYFYSLLLFWAMTWTLYRRPPAGPERVPHER